MIPVCFQGKPFSITVIQVYASITNAKKVEAKWVPWRPTRSSRSNTKKGCTFHHRGLESKVGSQEISGVTDKFGLGVQNEAEQRLTEFCQENALLIANTLLQHREDYTWTSPDGQYWNQIDIFFAAKDGGALYSQQKQDWELTVAQIMNSISPNSDLNWRK